MNLLLRGILSKPWAIQSEYVYAHLPLIVNLLQGGGLDESNADSFKSEAYVVHAGSGFSASAKTALSKADKGSIAIIEANGPLMKHDQMCGPVGTATIASWIQEANSNPNIDGIVLKTDCPGSTVDGMEELGRVISNSKKPVVCYVDGIAASGGYWMASQCSQIIAGGKTTQIGCIGVRTQLRDYTEALAAQGIKVHDIYASNSPDKNLAQRNALAGEYTDVVAELDKVNEIFQATVRSGRPNIKDAALTGKTYMAQDAKRLGMIDKIGTLQDAISAAQNLAKKQTAMSNTSNTALSQYPNLCTALGWAQGFESTEDGVFMNEAEMATLEAALAQQATLAQANTNLNHERTALVNAATMAQGQVQSLQLELNNLKQQLQDVGTQRATNGVAIAPPVAAVEAPNPAPEAKYIPDGTEKLAKKYGMDTSTWGMAGV